MFKHAFLLILSFCWSCMVLAGEMMMVNDVPVEITSIAANGAGCPSGSVTVTATEDYSQLVVLFSQYRAITNSSTTVAASDCNFAVGLSVPAGYSVGVVGADWRGTVAVGADAFVNFHREFFFSGSQGPVSEDNWTSPGLTNFFLEDNPLFVVYSGCNGTPLIARADTSATVVGADSLFTLRAGDFESQLFLTLSVASC